MITIDPIKKPIPNIFGNSSVNMTEIFNKVDKKVTEKLEEFKDNIPSGNGVPIVDSEDKLETLDLPQGSLASVAINKAEQVFFDSVRTINDVQQPDSELTTEDMLAYIRENCDLIKQLGVDSSSKYPSNGKSLIILFIEESSFLQQSLSSIKLMMLGIDASAPNYLLLQSINIEELSSAAYIATWDDLGNCTINQEVLDIINKVFYEGSWYAGFMLDDSITVEDYKILNDLLYIVKEQKSTKLYIKSEQGWKERILQNLTKVSQLENDIPYLSNQDVFLNTIISNETTLIPNTLIIVNNKVTSDTSITIPQIQDSSIVTFGILFNFGDTGSISNLQEYALVWENGEPENYNNKNLLLILTNYGNDYLFYGKWKAYNSPSLNLQAFYNISDNTEPIKITDFSYTVPTKLEGMVNNNNKTKVKEHYLFPQTGIQQIDFLLKKIPRGFFQNVPNLEKVIIPEGINEIPRDLVYSSYSLKELTIPNTVETVQDMNISEDHVNYKTLNIPSLDWLYNTTINGQLYGNNTTVYIDGTPVTSIIIPENIQFKHQYSFYNLRTLESITIPENYNWRWSMPLFSNTVNLKNVVFNGSNHVMRYLFSNCPNLTSIQIPENATLGTNCFENCGLTTLHIPENTKWEYEDTYGTQYWLIGCNKLESITGRDTVDDRFVIHNDYLIGMAPFGLENIVIPKNVKEYRTIVLKGYEGVKTLSLPRIGTDAYTSAFSDLPNLRTVTIDENLSDSIIETITSLTGSNLDSILEMFEGCYNLEKINFPGIDSPLFIQDDILIAAFDKDEVFTIPENVKTIASGALSIIKAKQIIIPGTVQKIAHGCFIKNPYFSDSYTNLETIIIEDGVQEIGDNCFRSSQIKEINIPNSVTYLGSNAFQYSRLQEATLGTGITALNARLFHSSDITKLKCLGNITFIGFEALYSVSKLELLDLSNCTQIPTMGTGSFGAMVNGTKFQLPSSCVVIVPDALYNTWRTNSYWKNYSIVKASEYVEPTE